MTRGPRTCPECGRTIKESAVTENCGACARTERAITEVLEEAVKRGILEHVGLDEYGQIVYRRARGAW
jgi:protein-arginine kinase activator protein McsA